MSENAGGQIRTNLSMVGSIMEFHMNQETNAHGSCILAGIVMDGCKDDFARENSSHMCVEVTLTDVEESGKDKLLFVGVIGELSIFQEGMVYRFKIKLYSATLLMDLEKKSRSFQNTEQTYYDLINRIVSEYDGGGIIDRLTGGKKTGRLLVQYQETDWEFLKRLASHFNGCLLPSCEFGQPKVFFGAKKQIDAGILEQHAYTMDKQILKYRRDAAGGYPELMEVDAVSFTVDAGIYYEIGSGVTYQDIPLYIGRIDAELYRGEVLFHYRLRTGTGMGRQTIYAGGLAGVSIPAEVLEVVKDKIKVKLDIDESQDKDTAWEFPYDTMYTAGDAGGWYCMPEKGDKVMVYFPGNREEEASASTSVRRTDVPGDRTEEPEIKFFRTIHGKEIRFTPETVEIICGNPSGGDVRSRITLHEDDGISIYSRDGITFTSGKGIRLEAEDEIEITASERIKLHCKKSRIQMDTMVDIAGPDVRIN